MSYEQDRDRVAELLGYRHLDSSPVINFPHWVDGRGVYVCYESGSHDGEAGEHPIPATLDGLIALLPKGWKWQRINCPTMNRWEWLAATPDGYVADIPTVPDTGNHIHDFTALLARVLEATKESSP